MSLRKPPTMTSARLAANRANAAKSTGPRTRAGKNRVRWNALKRGEHARSFREALIGMGENPRWFDFLYNWLGMKPEDAEDEREVTMMARELWWKLVGDHPAKVREHFRKTNPESLLESIKIRRRRRESRQPTESKVLTSLEDAKAVR